MPDGGTLCGSTYDGRLELHRPGTVPVALVGHDDAIHDMALSPDGSVVAMCGDGGLLQPVDGSPAHMLTGLVRVGAGRRGAEILVGSGDDDCRVVDGRTGVVLAAVRVQRMWELERPRLGPGNRIVRTFPAGAVDLDTGEAIAFPEDVRLGLGDMLPARSPMGTWAVAYASGHAREFGGLLVTDADGKPLLQEERGPVPAVAFSPDGSRLAYSCGESGMPAHWRNYRLRVLDGRTLKRLREFRLEIRWLRFLDSRLALVADEQGLAVLDTDTGDLVQRLAGVGRYGFELSDDCRTLACNDGRAVRVYRVTRQ